MSVNTTAVLVEPPSVSFTKTVAVYVPLAAYACVTFALAPEVTTPSPQTTVYVSAWPSASDAVTLRNDVRLLDAAPDDDITGAWFAVTSEDEDAEPPIVSFT